MILTITLTIITTLIVKNNSHKPNFTTTDTTIAVKKGNYSLRRTRYDHHGSDINHFK